MSHKFSFSFLGLMLALSLLRASFVLFSIFMIPLFCFQASEDEDKNPLTRTGPQASDQVPQTCPGKSAAGVRFDSVHQVQSFSSFPNTPSLTYEVSPPVPSLYS